MYDLNIYRGVTCHDSEEWWKIWKGIDLSVQNWQGEFDKLWPEHMKISKTCTLIGCFWPNYVMFELKQSTEELCLMALNNFLQMFYRMDVLKVWESFQESCQVR